MATLPAEVPFTTLPVTLNPPGPHFVNVGAAGESHRIHARRCRSLANPPPMLPLLMTVISESGDADAASVPFATSGSPSRTGCGTVATDELGH